MKGLIHNVSSAMTGNETRNRTPFLFFLSLISKIYGWGIKLRSAMYDLGLIRQKKLPCRVVSIGNLSVGGTGKTPMTVYLAQMLQGLGLKPAVVSRGYKGDLEKTGGVISDGEKLFADAQKAGDEPFMMAQILKGIPVLVGRNRFEAGMRAVKDFSADVIVLDDGFQHRRLKRDLDLVLIDDGVFFGNGHLIPRGILREPASGLSRCNACVLTRSGRNKSKHQEMLMAMIPGKEVFRAFHAPYVYGVFHLESRISGKSAKTEDRQDFSFLSETSAFIFSGIARNSEFRAMIAEKVNSVAGYLEFPDHHPYTRQDMENIMRHAVVCGADMIITTEKDFSRMDRRLQRPMDLVVIGVNISFGDETKRFSNFIRRRILNSGMENEK
jgi:tetraacyldisaccharide 4'-kinase